MHLKVIPKNFVFQFLLYDYCQTIHHAIINLHLFLISLYCCLYVNYLRSFLYLLFNKKLLFKYFKEGLLFYYHQAIQFLLILNQMFDFISLQLLNQLMYHDVYQITQYLIFNLHFLLSIIRLIIPYKN